MVYNTDLLKLIKEVLEDNLLNSYSNMECELSVNVSVEKNYENPLTLVGFAPLVRWVQIGLCSNCRVIVPRACICITTGF